MYSGLKSNENLTPMDLTFGPLASISLILYIGKSAKTKCYCIQSNRIWILS